MATHINIARSIQHHWIWQNAEYLKWWLDILMLAVEQETKTLTGRKLVTLDRGQFIGSLAFLCGRWGCSRTKAKNLIDLLRQEGMIDKHVRGNISVITVLCYDEYVEQDFMPAPYTPCNTPCDTPCEHLVSGVNDESTGNCSMCDEHLRVHLDDTLDALVNDYMQEHLPAMVEKSIEARMKNVVSGCVSESIENAFSQSGIVEKIRNAYKNSTSGQEEERESKENKEKRTKKENKEKKEREEGFTLFSDENSVSKPSFDSPSFSDIEQKIVSLWNDGIDETHSVMNKIRSLGGKRRGVVAARCREYGVEAVKEMIGKALRSDFLNGKNGKGWMGTFDWVMLPSNFQKVLEGNYDNGTAQPQAAQNNSNNEWYKQYVEQKRREEIVLGRMEPRNRRPEDYEKDWDDD